MRRASRGRGVACFLLSVVIVFFAAAGPSSADYSTTGVVGGPHPFTYTVKCAPGDRFEVAVSSDYATSVDILALTPDSRAHGGWAVNSVASSRRKAAHSLSYAAPAGKPENNATHWHYKISILASTQKQTKFMLKITQYGSGASRSKAYVEQVNKQLQALGRAMKNEQNRLNTEIKQRSERIKSIDSEQKRKKERLVAELAELERLNESLRNEKNKAVRSSMQQTLKSRTDRYNASVESYNKTRAARKALYDEYKALGERRSEIDNLREALREALGRNDYDRCVIIANGSRLALSLDWKTMKR